MAYVIGTEVLCFFFWYHAQMIIQHIYINLLFLEFDDKDNVTSFNILYDVLNDVSDANTTLATIKWMHFKIELHLFMSLSGKPHVFGNK